jgi:hypothetical protein
MAKDEFQEPAASSFDTALTGLLKMRLIAEYLMPSSAAPAARVEA